MTAGINDNWGYPTEDSFKVSSARPHPSEESISPQQSGVRHPTQTYQLSSSTISVYRVLLVFVISAAIAALILFPLRQQALGLLRRVSLDSGPRFSVRAAVPIRNGAAREAAPRRSMLYRCGNTWKDSPAWDEECSAVEALIVRDDRGNQYITQNW